jgi:hypothetical protein
MVGDMTWTPQKPLTFFMRVKMTFFLFLPPWKRVAECLAVLWSNGATVSFSRTVQPVARSVTVKSKKGEFKATANVTSKEYTVTVTTK